MDSCYQNRAAIFKALGDENRWKILDILKGGEKCACVLLNKLEISQPTLSHHMKIHLRCPTGKWAQRGENGPTIPLISRESSCLSAFKYIDFG